MRIAKVASCSASNVNPLPPRGIHRSRPLISAFKRKQFITHTFFYERGSSERREERNEEREGKREKERLRIGRVRSLADSVAPFDFSRPTPYRIPFVSWSGSKKSFPNGASCRGMRSCRHRQQKQRPRTLLRTTSKYGKLNLDCRGQRGWV